MPRNAPRSGGECKRCGRPTRRAHCAHCDPRKTNTAHTDKYAPAQPKEGTPR